MLSPELYTRIVVTRDVPEADLQQGDTAMYIDYIPVSAGEDGAILEVFNALGDSLAVVSVPMSAIAPLDANYVPTVRLANTHYS
jgi:hypothetical protein